jgi:hypothetical protein
MQGYIHTRNALTGFFFLVKAGCPHDYVGEVIEHVFNTAGISVKGSMSGRTVTHCIIEGGIAAQIQLGYEMVHTPNLTIAKDGTTHENVNYEAKLVHMPVGSYTDDNSAKLKHVTCTLDVHSAPNYTSETQVNGWKEVLLEIVEIFMNSPLAKSAHLQFSLKQFYEKLKGMNSDHAEDQKTAFRLLAQLKRDVAIEALGAKRITEIHTNEFNQLLNKKRTDLINDCGGEASWDAFTDEEQTAKLTELLQDVSIEIGMLEFFWVGCGMHKDLNGVRGGNVAMMRWWLETGTPGTPGPILLANKDNAAVINAIPADDSGKHGAFLDTGNTHYGSHHCAACELILHLGLYNEFMESKKKSKDSTIWKAIWLKHC